VHYRRWSALNYAGEHGLEANNKIILENIFSKEERISYSMGKEYFLSICKKGIDPNE